MDARTDSQLRRCRRTRARHGVVLLIAASSVLPSVAAGAGRESTVSPFQFDRALAAAIDKGLRAATFEDEEPQVKRVYVKCYRDASAFEEPLQPRFGIARPETRALTAYYAGGGELHLRNGSCANARLFAAGVMRWDTAAAFSVLLHEALHRQGIDGERATTCLGNDAVRWAAVALGYLPAADPFAQAWVRPAIMERIE